MVTGEQFEIADPAVAWRERDPDGHPLECGAPGFARNADEAVGDDDGALHSGAFHVLRNAFDARTASGLLHASSQFVERDISDLGREEVDDRMHEVPATKHCGVERSYQVADAPRDIEVDMHLNLRCRHPLMSNVVLVEQGSPAERMDRERAPV